MSMISELVKELRNEAQEVRLCSNECESAELLDRAADTIEMLSEKARADRPRGEWICKGDWAECSLCGADSGTIMDGLERVPRYTRFCPECGARMKGADDEHRG